MNKVLKFGIAPVPVQRARSLAIAAGTRQRTKDEPNVWFPTVTAMARVLSDENMALLKVIRERVIRILWTPWPRPSANMRPTCRAHCIPWPNTAWSSSPNMAARSFRRQPLMA